MGYKDFDCSAQELSRRMEAYFSECESTGKAPTASGLCMAIGLPFNRLKTLMRLANELSASPASRGEVKRRYKEERLQWEHIEALQRGMLQIQSELENTSNTMAVFQLKQPWLGGYTDKLEAQQQPLTVNVRLLGTEKTDAFG